MKMRIISNSVSFRRVKFTRDMDHVARHLASEVRSVYCTSIYHLNPACTIGFEYILILLQH
jgi:hypothetical protein